MKISKVGLIGVGHMGHGIARNLLAGGYALNFLSHPGNRDTGDLVDSGAQSRRAIAELVGASELVLTCVTGSPEVEQVVLGDTGVARYLERGQILADLSTVEPATSARVQQAVRLRGADYLDCPMTRTPKEAEAGRLNLIVGGETAVLARVKPVFECFAENIYHAGAAGTGHALKLLHNFVSLGNCALLAEATACARRAGVATDIFIKVLREGGGDSVALSRMTPYLNDGDTAGFLFSVANCAKDLGYYQGMAEELGASADVTAAIHGLYRRLRDEGHGAAAVPRIVDFLSA